MNTALRFKLSLMMFLQFFIWGVWWVPLAVYMGSARVGMEAIIFLAYLSQPIAAMISPFFLGLVADRFFASEKLLAALHLLGAVMLLLVPYFGEMGEGGRTGFIALVILHMLCYMPTIGLTNTIAFKTMADPERHFPVIRVWGTLGWIVSGLVVGVGLNWVLTETAEQTVWPFYLAAGAAVLLAVFSLFLPHTPPPMKGKRASAAEIVGLHAVRQLSSRSFWTFIIASVLLCIPLAAYYSYTALFVGDGGVENLAAWMSTGQMAEVVFMLLMPLAFRKLGVKWMLLAGMLAWVVRYALFSIGAPDQVFWMILVGIMLHGICYDFFFVTGMVYVEKKAPEAIRAQAQGFLVQMTLGVGMFAGMLVSGRLFNLFVEGTTGAERMQQYQTFWMIPAAFSLLVMIGFAIFFKEKDASLTAPATPGETPVGPIAK